MGKTYKKRGGAASLIAGQTFLFIPYLILISLGLVKKLKMKKLFLTCNNLLTQN